MATRAAISIGVDKVIDANNLPILRAAAQGAKDFHDWAVSQGIESTLLTDAAGPVTAADIKSRVAAIVAQGTYQQLIVFFAGHGILKAAETEIWLLSNAATDSNEAVNLAGSIPPARNAGIPHLVFISDACRSLVSDFRLAQVTGSIVFPIRSRVAGALRGEVDLLYAAGPGDTAFELPPDQSTTLYSGVFTSCLLDALRNPPNRLLEEIPDGGPMLRVVSARGLKPYLESVVPDKLEEVAPSLNQVPDIIPAALPPKHIGRVMRLSGLSAYVRSRPAPLPPSPRPSDMLRGLATEYKLDHFFAPEAEILSIRTPTGVADRGFASDMTAIMQGKGRESYETRTGFSVIGAEVVEAFVPGGSADVFKEDPNGPVHIRVHGSSGSVFIRFANGNGACLAALNEFIGTVSVDGRGGVANVNYTPSRHTWRYDVYMYAQEEIEKRRAFIAVAARRGYLRIEPDKAGQFAGYIRGLKSVDPTLGLYAAYAYAQAGMLEDAESVYDYMHGDNPSAMLFDVALLAERLGEISTAPVCPLLTQGWSLLHEGLPVDPVLFEAAKHLTPSLWTTFTPTGFDLVRNHTWR